MADNISEIKNALKEEKVIIGTDNTIKDLKLGKLSKVFVSSNAPKDVKEKIEKYSKLNETKLVKLKSPNNELGGMCKRPFSISVLAIKGA